MRDVGCEGGEHDEHRLVEGRHPDRVRSIGEWPCRDPGGRRDQHRAIDPRTARLAELLSSTFTVYHYDRRGRGDSGDTAPYAVEREIDDIDALIQEASGSAYLFGMSSGAVLGLDAADRGLAVTKLALYDLRSWSTTADRRSRRTTASG